MSLTIASSFLQGAVLQAIQIFKRTALHLGSDLRPGEAERFVSRTHEFLHDSRSDESGRTNDKNPYFITSKFGQNSNLS